MIRPSVLTPFLIRFDPWGSLGESLGPAWGAFGPRLLKTTKKHFWGVSFWTIFVTNVGTVVVTVFCMFSKPLSCYLLVPKAPTDLNFDSFWAPFWSRSEQIWESGNYDSVSEWTRKSSFGGSVFHLDLSFACACFRDLCFL